MLKLQRLMPLLQDLPLVEWLLSSTTAWAVAMAAVNAVFASSDT